MDGGEHPNGPLATVEEKSFNTKNCSMTTTESATFPTPSYGQRVHPSLSSCSDMWKHFSQMSLSENSLQETRASDIKKVKPKLPDFKPSKYSKEEAVSIIQRAWRGALAMRRVIKRKKNQRTRLNIIKEMVDTEATYVATLETIFYQFELPLRALLSQEKEIITEEEIKTIFSSVEVILGFSSHLLQRLRERFEEWQDLPPGKQHVGDIFVEMKTYTKVYVSYVSNYEASAALCLQLRKKNEHFEQWEKESLSTLSGNHSSIGFLLITPVQRIPRYLMLVQTMLKATWEGHQDVSPLSEALESIKETAVIVDKRTAETERMQKISEIEDSIGGKFETLREAKRRYVMEGELDVISDGKARKTIRSTRYFFLFNDLLVVCKYAKMASLRGSLKGSLKGSKGRKGQKAGPILFEFRSRSWLATDEKVGSVVEKESIEGITNIFEIVLPSAKFTVATRTEAIKLKWIEELTAAFVDLEPKVQFKQDVAKKMSSEKAKRARALIAQQYAHMRVAEQRGEVEGEEGEVGEGEGYQSSGSSLPNTRRFRAHRNDMTDMKMHENAQKAEEQINALMQEEQEIKDSKEKEKKKKEEERIQALEDMKNRYKREMGCDSPTRGDERIGRKKKTRRTLAMDDALSSPEGSPKREKAEQKTPPPSPEAAPRRRAFRRLADETCTNPR